MEYEFKSDLTGGRLAQLSMGHEAFGRLLTEELAEAQAVSELLVQVQALQTSIETRQWQLGEWVLTVEKGEVELQANALASEQEYELDPDVELYDEESLSSCGLEDLIQLLESWQRFIGTGRRRTF
ncbi:YacL family protein [Ferrimonas aestuarii]|uniref:UPF0231 family protein n=1 Tax=Ferrimonas aestuarii TaxID=2569539 RepID=A0A4U1BJJ8_9GAMM|nr:YacL family protein [Ferrimonas aestuarii]TKB50938.1 UPF0231 family protein [Ferrimonas aestuarii]